MSKPAPKLVQIQTEVEKRLDQLEALYLEDQIPWVVGYSGGKDSTAVLQLVWMMIERLSPAKQGKAVHVITTDTLVENPIVSFWVAKSIHQLNEAAEEKALPLKAHLLTPALKDSFWVNLIGKGYPAPRQGFRWCTDRLKIKPCNRFITEMIQSSGEVILLLGTRSSESATRAAVLTRYANKDVRRQLNSHNSLANCYVLPIIKEWTNDDVWMFLNQYSNPWGYSNKDLMSLYRGASPDAECPVVVDTSTPSCGDSRFGCWVCTMVSKDKSMSAMIRNDRDKAWLKPLLKIRDELDIENDRHLRDFRRMSGKVQFYKGREVPGPYTQESRSNWLRKVLAAQHRIGSKGPADVSNISLIQMEELHEIRRVWVLEKNEIEDELPRIYEEVIDQPFPKKTLDSNPIFPEDELQILKKVCEGQPLHYELTRNLLSIEHKFRSSSQRRGIFETLAEEFGKSFYEDASQAVAIAHQRDKKKKAIEETSLNYYQDLIEESQTEELQE
jgi:DNA sulfur modification protein DndC